MNLRIIAGSFGSRGIKAPRGHATHPMSERIRGALFNSVGPALKDAEVLDAFAGSGSIGLEAISRGAKHATFIERDREAVKVLTGNIELLGCGDVTKVINSGVASWADRATQQFDIIFADPPYNNPQFSTVERLFGLLKPNGLMVLSYPGRSEAPTGTNGVVVVDNRSYGTAALAFYRRMDV